MIYDASNGKNIKRQPHDNMAQTKQYSQKIFASNNSLLIIKQTDKFKNLSAYFYAVLFLPLNSQGFCDIVD